jgi:hypothetical protein
MAKHIVKCRVCGQQFDTNDPTVQWVMPSKNFYYHSQCYEDYAKKKTAICNDIHADVDNTLWFDALYDYLKKDLKVNLNMMKMKSQWENFLKKGYTAKGIFFCMKYFYDVLHNDPNKSDGIGIISFIYQEGCQYWVDREQHDAGICARIEAQIARAQEQKQVVIRQKQKKKTKPTIDLSVIANMEDEV